MCAIHDLLDGKFERLRVTGVGAGSACECDTTDSILLVGYAFVADGLCCITSNHVTLGDDIVATVNGHLAICGDICDITTSSSLIEKTACNSTIGFSKDLKYACLCIRFDYSACTIGQDLCCPWLRSSVLNIGAAVSDLSHLQSWISL